MSDLISRQVAIKEITVNPINESLFSADFLKGFRCGAKRQFQADAKEIAKAPSVRPKGEWEQISPARIYQCSNCGQNVMTNDIDVYKFCHGCGADMRGGGSNEID